MNDEYEIHIKKEQFQGTRATEYPIFRRQSSEQATESEQNVPNADLISRKAAIDALRNDKVDTNEFQYDENVDGYNDGLDMAITELSKLPSVTPKYKTDHGYMWLCPKCGLDVHSDFKSCVRCGYTRNDANSATPVNYGSTKDATAKSEDVPDTNVGECEGDMDDLISRQAAIQIASGYCHPANIAKELEKLPSVTPQSVQVSASQCEDAISRQAAIDAMFAEMPGLTFDEVLRVLRNLPSVTPQRMRSAWIGIDDYPHDVWECGQCGYIFEGDQSNYCPNCGAYMREEIEEG